MRLSKYAPVIAALLCGVVIGVAAFDIHRRLGPRPAPAPVMHTVVVTEDGFSETYSMPTGTLVTTLAVHNSCSITIDGRFAAFISGVVGNAECGATIR